MVYYVIILGVLFVELKKTEEDDRIELSDWLSEMPLNRQETRSWGALWQELTQT